MKPDVRKIVNFFGHFTKEIVIALILAFIAAIVIEIYFHEVHKRNVERGRWFKVNLLFRRLYERGRCSKASKSLLGIGNRYQAVCRA
jgi:hypothetical protein